MTTTYPELARVAVYMPTTQHPDRSPAYRCGTVVRWDTGHMVNSIGYHFVRLDPISMVEGVLYVIAHPHELRPI